MIPLDKAVDMLRGLSEADCESASNYIQALASGWVSPERLMSRAQILGDLALSRQQAWEGKHCPAQEAIDGVMADYGLLPR